MSTGKKVLNIFGIIFAWILSIILVVILFVTPLTMSALNTVTPKNMVQTLSRIELSQFMDTLGDDLGLSDDPMIAAFVNTNTAQELYEAYLNNFLSILDSDIAAESLTDEKLQEIVSRNIDELYQISLQQEPDLGKLPEEEAKKQLEPAMVESLRQIRDGIPSADTLKQELQADETAVMVLGAFSQLDTAKLALVTVIVVLALLIFVCRLFGLRGFRWLAVDLFVASGLGACICVGLSMAMPILQTAVAENPIVSLVVENLLAPFIPGVYIRTAIILVSAVILLVAYILIKKSRAKKVQPVLAEEPAPEV